MGGFFAAFPDAAYTLQDIFFAGEKGVLARDLAWNPERGLGRIGRHGP